MHDPVLWASWYILLLLVPLMIFVLVVRDALSQQQPVAERPPGPKRRKRLPGRPPESAHR